MRRCEIRVPKFNSVEAENGAKTDNRREVTNLGSLQFSQVGRLSRKITVPRSPIQPPLSITCFRLSVYCRPITLTTAAIHLYLCVFTGVIKRRIKRGGRTDLSFRPEPSNSTRSDNSPNDTSRARIHIDLSTITLTRFEFIRR